MSREICDLNYAVNNLIERIERLEPATQIISGRVAVLEAASPAGARPPEAPPARAWPTNPPALNRSRSLQAASGYYRHGR